MIGELNPEQCHNFIRAKDDLLIHQFFPIQTGDPNRPLLLRTVRNTLRKRRKKNWCCRETCQLIFTCAFTVLCILLTRATDTCQCTPSPTGIPASNTSPKHEGCDQLLLANLGTSILRYICLSAAEDDSTSKTKRRFSIRH